MAPGLTTRPPLRRGALPHEFAEIRRRANTGWGDRPAWSARIEGRPRPFGQDECRGTDVVDCQWIQERHSVGLLRGSFRPTAAIAALRAYLRHRETLVQSAAMHVQRMQKALVQMNF